jgi:hypothetical protein
MDWTPTSGGTREESTDWMRPPRFAPEKPTGLEGLLEKFGIGGDEAQEGNSGVPQNARQGAGIGRGVLIGVFVGIGAAAIAAGIVMWQPLGLREWKRSADA